MGAADATLAEALDYFDGDWRWLAGELLDGRCALWLGSAISMRRFPNLGGLIEIAFTRLHERDDPRTIRRLVELAKVDRAIDPTVAFDAWPAAIREAVIDGLWYHYSEVLGMPTADGSNVKALLDLPTIYADPEVEPDADHRFLALLIEEGAVVEMVSGNWDELIERAHEDCVPRRGMRSIVRAEEMVVGVDQPTLFKFHGCARKARADRALYEPLMVATDDEIATFETGDAARPIREALRTSIRRRPVLMVGLSGQDRDIQATFDLAAEGLEGAFSIPDPVDGGPRPRLSVAGDTGKYQDQLLEQLHGAAFEAEPEAFKARAGIPLYAKPFFGGLIVHTLLVKARLSVDHPSPGQAPAAVRALATSALDSGRRLLCRRAAGEGQGTDEGWLRLATELVPAISSLVGLYRDQRAPATAWTYISPWSGQTVRDLREAPHLVWGFAYDRLLACLDLLRRVGVRPGWALRLLRADEPGHHATVEHGGRARRIVVLLPSTGRDLLAQRGALDDIDDPNLVFLYAVGPRPASQTRAPRSDLPRGRGAAFTDEPSELWLDDLLGDDLDRVVDDLAWELVA
ncbi:MAG: SIR2 family protein [Acidobacteriota bacterium]